MVAASLGLLTVTASASVLLPQGPAAPTPPASKLPKGLDAEVRKTLQKARPALMKHLKQQRGGVRALLCLAALHDGIPIDNKIFAHALKRLSKARLTGTYEAALRLMVMAEHPGFPRRHELLFTDTKSILKNRAGGGFTYHERNGWWDLSNTQYAALGLRAAVSMGHKIDNQVWREIAEAILPAQHKDGGFGYSLRNRRKGAYSSMTVAGIAILQICKQNLPATELAKGPARGPADKQLGKRMDKAIRHAWDYMEQNRFDIGNDHALSTLYFHYGLERAAILSDVVKIGASKTDWYAEGARMLVDIQEKSGAWRSGWEIRPGALPSPGSPVDTAFAILFLRRQFKKALPKTYRTLLALGAQATESEIQLAARLAIQEGMAAVPQVLKAMRSRMEPQRRAAAIAIRALSKNRFRYDPTRRPEESSDLIKAAELWWLKHPDRGSR